MNRKYEILLIYLTGLVQGIVLVTVPAASSILTDPDFFGFSGSAYGTLFIELENMYVVDGSFFVSSTAVNPGLTIMANALRVGDHILSKS